MTVNPARLQVIQLGKEVTPGTPVSCNRRMLGWEMDGIEPVDPIEMIEPIGLKAAVGPVAYKPNSKTSISMKHLCPNHLLHALAGRFGTPSSSVPTSNGVYTLTLGTPSGGNYTLTLNSLTTANIAYNANAAAIQAACDTAFGAGTVIVSGTGPFTITLVGAYYRNTFALTGSFGGLTGGSPGLTTTAASTTNRYRFFLSPFALEPPQTYTIQRGNSANATQAPLGFIPSWSIDAGPKSCECKGDMLLGYATKGISLTGGPSDVPIRAVSPANMAVYVGNSLYGVSNPMTKLKIGNADCYKVMWAFKDSLAGVLDLDLAETSFSGVVEKGYGLAAQIVCEDDSANNTFLTELRGMQEKFALFYWTGTQIESGYNYGLQIKFAFNWFHDKPGTEEDVQSGTWDMRPIYTADFMGGGVCEIIIDTDFVF